MRFWTTHRSYNDFFNSDPWPGTGHPETMKLEPLPRLFSHQAVKFYDVELPLYRVLGRTLCASNHKQRQRYVVWVMCQNAQCWYGASQNSGQRLGDRPPRTCTRGWELEDGRVG